VSIEARHRERGAIVSSTEIQDPTVEELRRVAERLLLVGLREQAAREEAERLAAERAAILDELAAGVVLVDAVASITSVNDAARRLDEALQPGLGLAAYAAGGRLRRLDGHPYPFSALPAVRALRGEVVIGAEARLLRTDGSELLLHNSASPVRTREGGDGGAVWVLQDIAAEHDWARRNLPPDFLAGDLAISFASQRVTVGGVPVALTPLEYHLLLYLVQNAGHVLPAKLLLDRIWRRDYDATRDSLKVYISRLRAKIDPRSATRPIETVRGLGYRFRLPSVTGAPPPAGTPGEPGVATDLTASGFQS
jgi:DNA-binding winged helix-turn-helix (wHTH) protein/PAS domain-containing protein